MAGPSRGEIWWVDFDPTRGHEQGGRRPAVVISVDSFNHGHAGLIVVVPITTKARGIPLHVQIKPPDGGVKQMSFAKCEDLRSVTTQRLSNRIGKIRASTLSEIETRVRLLLGL